MTYSRLKDTSYLPREPIIAGHKVTSREHMHTMMARNPEMMRDKIKELIKIKKELGKGDEDALLNYVDSGRLDDINKKDMHKQRQLHRNRKAQIRNVLEHILREYSTSDAEDENIKANATRLKKVIFDPKTKKRRRDLVSPDNFSVWATSERADVDSN